MSWLISAVNAAWSSHISVPELNLEQLLWFSMTRLSIKFAHYLISLRVHSTLFTSLDRIYVVTTTIFGWPWEICVMKRVAFPYNSLNINYLLTICSVAAQNPSSPLYSLSPVCAQWVISFPPTHYDPNFVVSAWTATIFSLQCSFHSTIEFQH